MENKPSSVEAESSGQAARRGAEPDLIAPAASDSSDAAITPVVYQQLKRLARSFMSKERSGHTLQATDLVHSAYVRLFEQEKDFSGSRTHFIALAATMMRRILVNHAISHKTNKRGAGAVNLTLSAAEQVEQPGTEGMIDIIELDRALEKLKQIDERMVTIIELRYFSGMTIEDTADSLGISAATVKREWNIGKLWLLKELNKVD